MKHFFILLFFAFGLSNVNGQNSFNLGIGLGLPLGNAGDTHIITVNLDASYLWELSEQFDAGIASGFLNSFGDSEDIGGGVIMIDTPDVSFIPIAGSARYNISEEFVVGTDLGYAVGINPDTNDGGFYYAPRIQFNTSDFLSIVAAYRGVSVDGGSFDNLSVGLELSF